MALGESLRIGIIEYPPHIVIKKDGTIGKGKHYLSNIFNRDDFEVEYRYYPMRRAIKELEGGRLDLLLPVFKNDEKENIKHFQRPLFYSVPGLCFKKENFIPILSATHRFSNLTVGYPAGTALVPALKNSRAKLFAMEGTNVLERGIKMLLSNRIDAFYHPSPQKIYHYTNLQSRKVACSYFYGNASGVYIWASPKMSEQKFKKLEKMYNKGYAEKVIDRYRE